MYDGVPTKVLQRGGREGERVGECSSVRAFERERERERVGEAGQRVHEPGNGLFDYFCALQ
jgi:hypothetical protein